MNTTDIINGVLDREGGTYTDDPIDHGGATKWGVTVPTLTEFQGHLVSAQDIKNLTRSQAFDVYMLLFVKVPGFDKILDDRLRSLVIDSAVLYGRGTTIKWLQKMAGTVQDGVLGPITLSALAKFTPQAIYIEVCASRIERTGRIVSQDPTQVRFIAGWLNRATSFIRQIS